jgi:cyclopropane fatty-acyl-phospholipid synthase-like methyltransferase
MNWLGDLIQTEITDKDTVLDLGCGIMSATDGLTCKSVLGVDVWKRYLEHIKDRYQTVMISMEETGRFLNKSYDVVLCLDVLEHLEKNLALKIIDECKRIARNKVIIYTPSVHKDNSSAEKDAWGLGECPYQKHISVIDVDDFTSRGFRVKDPMKDNSHYAVYEVSDNGL